MWARGDKVTSTALRMLFDAHDGCTCRMMQWHWQGVSISVCAARTRICRKLMTSRLFMRGYCEHVDSGSFR